MLGKVFHGNKVNYNSISSTSSSVIQLVSTSSLFSSVSYFISADKTAFYLLLYRLIVYFSFIQGKARTNALENYKLVDNLIVC